MRKSVGRHMLFSRVNVSGSVTNLNMSDFVPPVNAEDAFKTSCVKGLQGLDMMTICLTTIQEDGNTDSFCYFALVAISRL